MTHTSSYITYADVDVNSIQLNLNHDLGNLNKWLISNKLTLNTAKTEFMLIGSRQKLSNLSSQPELSIDNAPIEKVTSVTSLGIFIDGNLRWQMHICKITDLKRSLPNNNNNNNNTFIRLVLNYIHEREKKNVYIYNKGCLVST